MADEKTQTLELTNQEQPDNQSLMTVNPMVVPVVTPEQAKEAWAQYQEMCRALLSGGDYQPIAGKSFKKKSAWRKLATAFNISVKILNQERREYEIEGKKYFVWEITAEATAMNGRFMSGTGSCASNERVFAHLEHDVRATAETRAKNRAISDLIGAGEVSAEEMEGVKTTNYQQPRPPQVQVAQRPSGDGKPHTDFCPKGFDHQTLKMFTVNKEGANKGKKFVTCDTKTGGCGFFKFLDTQPKSEIAKEIEESFDGEIVEDETASWERK